MKKLCIDCKTEIEAKNGTTTKCDKCSKICQNCRGVANRGYSCYKCINKSHGHDYKIICGICGVGFNSRKPERKYCNACKQKIKDGKHKVPTLTCEWCKKDFRQRGGHYTKYCSKSCRYDALKVPNKDNRRGYKYKKWITSVYQRDNYTCQNCGAIGMIHAHHIKQWKDYQELRYEVSNGVTLCQDCHSIEHGRIIKRVSPRFKPVCSNCGKETKGRGITGLCQSCKNKKSVRQSIHLLSQ